MPGTIAIVDAAPPDLGLRKGGTAPQKKYKVSVDGKVLSETVGLPGKVQVDPGVHSVRISVNGFRTKTVKLEVIEGGRHVVRITPKVHGRDVSMLFGLVGVLVGIAWPGLYWRAEYSQS